MRARKVGYLEKFPMEIMDELDMRVPAYVMEIDLAALKKWYGKSSFHSVAKICRRKT